MTEMAAPYVLETNNLCKNYGGIEALKDASFSMKKGETIAIVGDNGAGKSTFVRNITGVEKSTSGTVKFLGKEVNFENPFEARRSGIETVYQNLALIDFLNDNKIPVMIYYPVPLYKQDAFRKYVNSRFTIENVEQLCSSVFSLPIHTEHENSSQEFIINKVKEFFNR